MDPPLCKLDIAGGLSSHGFRSFWRHSVQGQVNLMQLVIDDRMDSLLGKQDRVSGKIAADPLLRGRTDKVPKIRMNKRITKMMHVEARG
jgi:hypothetical protein